MNKKILLWSFLLLSASLSGCFINPPTGGSLFFDGNMTTSNGEFNMNGELFYTGGLPTQDTYDNLSLELYTEDGTLIRKEPLGSLDAKNGTINISVSSSNIPEYVIFDSPDIWDGRTSVRYYVRSNSTDSSYIVNSTVDRSELPVTPDG